MTARPLQRADWRHRRWRSLRRSSGGSLHSGSSGRRRAGDGDSTVKRCHGRLQQAAASVATKIMIAVTIAVVISRAFPAVLHDGRSLHLVENVNDFRPVIPRVLEDVGIANPTID